MMINSGLSFLIIINNKMEYRLLLELFKKNLAGYTTKRNNYEKQLQKKIMNIIGIKFQERQICVSKKECIKSTKLIYNEEEEVI